MFKIQFKYNLQFPSHEDIHVTYEEIQLDRWVDSYYLVLDQHVLPNVETFEKAIMVQKQILQNWQLMLKDLKIAEAIILPYEFSDEYLGFLYVYQIDSSNLRISTGWTQKYQGHSFIPSLMMKLAFEQSDLKLSTSSHIIEKNAFIEVLQNQQLVPQM